MYQHLSTSVFLNALLASKSLAAPLDLGDLLGGVVDHGQVQRLSVAGNARHGPAAFDRAYHKFGWAVPDGLPAALQKYKSVVTVEKLTTSGVDPVTKKPASGSGKAEGKVSATLAYQNSEYLSPVTVGGQELNMHIDTGSSDFWLFSTSLPKSERTDHTIYDPKKSKGYTHVEEATFRVKYGDNETLTGDVGADTVKIGGITVVHHTIELPVDISDGVREDPADGIVGLGFQPMNSICRKGAGSQEDKGCPDGYVSDPQPTWFENAKSTLRQGLFTVNMKPGSPGYYNFGSVDKSEARGEITYTPVDNSKGYWQFSTSTYKVGNGKTGSFKEQTAIADTGSSLLMLEPEVVEAYYANVRGAESDEFGYSFPCDVKLPDLTLALGKYEATIAGEIINYEPNPDGETCYGGIQVKGGGGFQVFGDILFNSQFAVFDYDKLRIGFAPHA